MREKLKRRFNQRERFKGTFEKYGLKSSYKGLARETLLFVDVQTISGEDVTDHLWFNLTKGFQKIGNLYPGDIVAFDARVRSYVKGYVGRGEDDREVDYKLSHPTKISILKRAEDKSQMGYYTICPKCDHRNKTSMLNRFPDSRPIGPGNPARCRRCGYNFTKQPLPKPEKFLQKKLFQWTKLF